MLCVNNPRSPAVDYDCGRRLWSTDSGVGLCSANRAEPAVEYRPRGARVSAVGWAVDLPTLVS
ncbi:hypothetical protein GCM10020358_73520 [Amorphoplanes nipponensis]|uniref:Uncharacterized protein n=1 Tax=Actinoplanes nipponensis TaxID=135950 RepID=A0A919JFI7_9ACTN|nr:hypothetical protein Ani05nite_33020 [Actinoplanes nipponensis]